MFKASSGIVLAHLDHRFAAAPDLVHGLHRRYAVFSSAWSNSRYREQYEDAVSRRTCAPRNWPASIFCTDGDAHYDEEVGGMSWQSYPLTHMDGHEQGADPGAATASARRPTRAATSCTISSKRAYCRGLSAPFGPGKLQYAAMWKTAQRMTTKPIKVGTPSAGAAGGLGRGYVTTRIRSSGPGRSARRSIAELHDLADAGCPVIQLEEPQIHMVPVRGKAFGKLDIDDLVEIFNNTVKGLRAKTEVWCHTCWGNPSQQRIFREVQSYQPTLDALNAR